MGKLFMWDIGILWGGGVVFVWVGLVDSFGCGVLMGRVNLGGLGGGVGVCLVWDVWVGGLCGVWGL